MNMRSFSLAALLALAATAVHAAPTLRGEVTVVHEIVTVGDMFEGAGNLSEKALFRAPAPGTAGTVSLDAVERAARIAGLTEYSADGVLRVRVARAATMIDEPMLTTLITQDLVARGIAGDGIAIRMRYDRPDPAFYAEKVPDPIRLIDLRYTPANGAFAARFAIAGSDRPVDLGGRIELMVEAPHLVAQRPAGTILGTGDIEMRLVPLKQAETAGLASLDQLVGKQLTRSSRGGLLLRPADVDEPRVVVRNAMVTVVLTQGPMTLTVKGQALNHAASGEPVQVLNTVSRKILHGVALPSGVVAVSNTINVAGL
jgi:flagellar basal body P-ring formation protein FlgA